MEGVGCSIGDYLLDCWPVLVVDEERLECVDGSKFRAVGEDCILGVLCCFFRVVLKCL